MKHFLLAWDWCKINWKFILGISIPILISIIMRRGNSTKIYQQAAETRKKELEISKAAHALESDKKRLANNKHDNQVNKIIDHHQKEVNRINAEHDKILTDINSAEKATQAIKDKLK